jgi:hypothetical protein
MNRTRDQLLGHLDVRYQDRGVGEDDKIPREDNQAGSKGSDASLHVNLGIAERARARGKLQRFHR